MFPSTGFAERNSYRAAIIAEKQFARALEQQADEIRLDVREELASVGCGRGILKSASLACGSRRRVEEQTLLSKSSRGKPGSGGRAERSHHLEEQLTQALVSHTISRLQFWRARHPQSKTTAMED